MGPRRVKRAVALLAVLIGFPAGAQTPPAPQSAPPEVYQESVRIYLRGKLLDPDSAKLELVAGPRWGSFVAVKTPWSKPEIGWLVCYSLNAKNAMGGYTGYQKVLFVVNAAGYAQSAYFEHDYDQPTGNRVSRECGTP